MENQTAPDVSKTEAFQKASRFLTEKLQARKNETDFFSEKGVEMFASFAWEAGREIAKLRRTLGWDSAILKELVSSLKQNLGENLNLFASDLFSLCDYYLGCERLSKPLWKPVIKEEMASC